MILEKIEFKKISTYKYIWLIILQTVKIFEEKKKCKNNLEINLKKKIVNLHNKKEQN